MKKSAIFASLILVVCMVSAADAGMSVPELEKGDILLCKEYSYRTVSNTPRTVYQLARLGFTNVRTFQDPHGLKADGVIGPETVKAAESEFKKQFNIKPQKYTDLKMLSLSVSPKMTEDNITVTITMRNESGNSLHIIGSITYDSDGNFLFREPTLPLSKKYCTRSENGKISYSYNPSAAEIVICPKGTSINPLKQISAQSSLPSLKPDQSGSMKIETAYIDSTLSTGKVEAGEMFPEKEEKQP